MTGWKKQEWASVWATMTLTVTWTCSRHTSPIWHLGLFHNNGKAEFDNTMRTARVGTVNRLICWGAGIVDLDNNEFPDLFITTGSVYPELERTLPQ